MLIRMLHLTPPRLLRFKLGLKPAHGVGFAKQFHSVNVTDPVLRCHAILKRNRCSNESREGRPIRIQVVEKVPGGSAAWSDDSLRIQSLQGGLFDFDSQ